LTNGFICFFFGTIIHNVIIGNAQILSDLKFKKKEKKHIKRLKIISIYFMKKNHINFEQCSRRATPYGHTICAKNRHNPREEDTAPKPRTPPIHAVRSKSDGQDRTPRWWTGCGSDPTAGMRLKAPPRNTTLSSITRI
jgi:hypothetical protein